MICARNGCDKKAKYYPKLILVPMEDREITRRAEMTMELPICHSHRREVTTDMLLTVDAWAAICKAFMGSGKPVPDRNRIGLGWTACEGYSGKPRRGEIITEYQEGKDFDVTEKN